MKKLADILKHYVEQNPPSSGDAETIVDQLFWAFMENHGSDNDKTAEYYRLLREQIKLPLREFDEVLYTISGLALEYGRVAFVEGLKIGMLLMQELEESDCGT